MFYRGPSNHYAHLELEHRGLNGGHSAVRFLRKKRGSATVHQAGEGFFSHALDGLRRQRSDVTCAKTNAPRRRAIRITPRTARSVALTANRPC